MDLKQLYQEVILDHNKNPRHFKVMEACDAQAVGHNPLCGDKLVVYLKLDGDTVQDLSFVGDGCAISKASASLMTELMRGKTVAECLQWQQDFHHAATHQDVDGSHLGKLQVLLGVREFPARVKCATLAWHTLAAALQQQSHAQTE